MPRAAKTYCKEPSCGVLVPSGYCAKHKREGFRADAKRRGTAAQRGYGSRWRRERGLFLQAHPLCVHCEKEDRIEAATVVDHIVPHKGDQALFWDRGNWQALCASCHGKKTAREDGGYGRAVKNQKG